MKKMKKSNFFSIIILLSIIFISIINIKLNILNNYGVIIIILLLLIMSYLLLGYEKVKKKNIKDIIMSIIIYVFIYYIVIYVIGYFTGLSRSIYSNNIVMIIKNIFPIIVTIILTEVLRYIINCKCNNIFLIILSCISFSFLLNILNLSMLFNSTLSSKYIIEQLSLYIIPVVMSNILYTYLSIKTGYKCNILYRLLMEIPIYLLPYFPNFGNYIESVLRISLPIIILFSLTKSVEKNNIISRVILSKKTNLNLLKSLIFIICIILVYFVSDSFKYKAYVIASGSMQPNINIGDVVVIKPVDTLQEGDIILFRSDGKHVCHRIVDIIESDEILYETKGDNNPSVDQYLVRNSDIVGKLSFKINYIGYLTVLINNL